MICQNLSDQILIYQDLADSNFGCLSNYVRPIFDLPKPGRRNFGQICVCQSLADQINTQQNSKNIHNKISRSLHMMKVHDGYALLYRAVVYALIALNAPNLLQGDGESDELESRRFNSHQEAYETQSSDEECCHLPHEPTFSTFYRSPSSIL